MVQAAEEFLVQSVAIGAGATAVLDLWAWFLQRVARVPAPDWALLGRWIGHFPRGRFAHASIVAAARVAGERALGWIAHYAIGIFYAAVLLWLCGPEWANRPRPGPALLLALATLAFPFFMMQPAFGFGIAASKTPNPTQARLRSLLTHTVFGLGLYASAWLLAFASRQP